MKFNITTEMVEASMKTDIGGQDGLIVNSPGDVRGVSIVWRRRICTTTLTTFDPVNFWTMPVSRSLASVQVWKPLPLAMQLGLSICYKHSPGHEGFDSLIKAFSKAGGSPPSPFHDHLNLAILALTQDFNIDLPNDQFGCFRGKLGGEILLTHPEHKDLDATHVKAFYMYVITELTEVSVLVRKGDIAAAKALAAVEATPKAFAMYFKQLSSRKIVDYGVKDLKELECPVLCDDFCEVCGSEHLAGAPGAKLSHCSNCSWALYCSRRCEKKDWAAHKVLCQRL